MCQGCWDQAAHIGTWAMRQLNGGEGGVFTSQVPVTSTQVNRNLFSLHTSVFYSRSVFLRD